MGAHRVDGGDTLVEVGDALERAETISLAFPVDAGDPLVVLRLGLSSWGWGFAFRFDITLLGSAVEN